MRNLEAKCEIHSVERGSIRAVNFTLVNGDRQGATKELPSPPDAGYRGSDLAVTAGKLNAGAGGGRLGAFQETASGVAETSHRHPGRP